MHSTCITKSASESNYKSFSFFPLTRLKNSHEKKKYIEHIVSLQIENKNSSKTFICPGKLNSIHPLYAGFPDR